nr:hypothetical protein [Tanacetum cinerariifolium]
MALTLMAKAFKLKYSTPTNNNQRISSNPRNRQIAQPGMNMGQDRQMQMVGGNSRNQFRQYAGQNAGNLTRLQIVQKLEIAGNLFWKVFVLFQIIHQLQETMISLSSFAELLTRFPEQFHNYQQLHRCLQEDR